MPERKIKTSVSKVVDSHAFVNKGELRKRTKIPMQKREKPRGIPLPKKKKNEPKFV